MRLFAQLVNSSVTLRAAALAVGLSATAMACSDDAPAATADAISWKLTALTGGSGTQGHDPALDTLKYKIRCARDEAGWQIRIEDPGREGPTTVELNGATVPVFQRSQSVLTISNINQGNCNVKVQEGEIGKGQPEYTGSCAKGCTLTVTEPTGGYDFQGQLLCAALVRQGGAQEFTLGSATGQPAVLLNLSNCN